MKLYQPVIKWTGSKRNQANEIISYFPKQINTYYEPFCGGCSVLRALLESDIKVENYVCSDINHDLIILWKTIKLAPSILSSSYKQKWKELNIDDNIERKKEFYEKIRKRFNKDKNPMDFIFLNRTCYNGLIKYNSNEEFDTPFNNNRNGIDPENFDKIVREWSELLNDKKVVFFTKDYKALTPTYYDFMYLDPPYNDINDIKTQEFDNKEFFEWLKNKECGWALSHNQKKGNNNNIFDVPKDLYSQHVLYMKSENSNLKTINGLYIK